MVYIILIDIIAIFINRNYSCSINSNYIYSINSNYRGFRAAPGGAAGAAAPAAMSAPYYYH